MVRKIIPFIICIISSLPLFCVSQTIVFEEAPLALEPEEFLSAERSEEFQCEISNSTKSLHLNYTGIQGLKENFTDAVPITCVNLEGNNLRHITENIFNNFPNLTFLNLANNEIPIYQFLLIGKHDKLHTLILDGNGKEDYGYLAPFNSHEMLPNLKKLYLRNNGINSISDSGNYSFPSLTHLYLSGNSERSGALQKSINNIPKTLTHFEFEDNNICRFNGSNFKNMSTLIIGGNQFETLGFFRHSYLNIANMSRLKSLSASRCDVRKIEVNAFEGTHNLEKLDLSLNFISVIPENTFKGLTSLRVISLNSNRLNDFPKEVCLKGLKKLFLSYNNMDTIEKDSLKNCTGLEVLSLRGNRIKEIEQNAFINLINLIDLDLAENNLHNLHANWGQALKALRNLNMNSNEISSIDALFLENSSVENVFLSGKKIRNITMAGLRENVVLRLDTAVQEKQYTNSRFQYKRKPPIQCSKKNL